MWFSTGDTDVHASITGRELIYSAYGVDVQESDDSIIATAEHGLEASIVAMSPGRFWVDIFPICEQPALTSAGILPSNLQ